MSETIRTVKSGRFSIIDNQLLENVDLSLQAKGLQAYLLSRPDGWTISPAHLSSTCRGGVSQIKATLKELEIARYIHREQLRDDKGRMNGWISWIYENPTLNPHPVRTLSRSRKSACGKPDDGKSAPINTDINKTEEIKDQDARAIEFEPSPTLALAAGDPLTREEPEEETTQEGLDELSHQPVHSVFEFSENGKGSAACRTTFDNTTTITGKPRYDSREANRARAKSHSNYDLGLKNKRWNDQQDFKKFEDYAADWVKNHPELVLGGKKEPDNPKGYLIGLLTRTAQCVDDGSKDLICWKNWQLEKQAFSPEFVAPELAVVTTTIEESRARFKKLLDASSLEIAKNRAAQEAEQKASQEKRWGLMSA